MNEQRVVITGMGVVAPNGVGLDAFSAALKNGKSGIAYFQSLADLNFSCCVGGIPPLNDKIISNYFTPLHLRNFNSDGIIFGCIAGMDAWRDAGLTRDNNQVDFDSGTIFGTGTSGVEKFREAIYQLDKGNVRRLGSTVVAQTMASGVSAYLAGFLGLGNQVTTNSAACATGTEAILLGYERIKQGKAKRMLVGSCSDHGPYIWGGFDAMRVMTYKHNSTPEKASRPMSASAAGFVPGSGAGGMVLESLESAQARGARIYAEVLGGHVNSGGQRNGGSMTAPNPLAVQKCIKEAIVDAGISASEIDLINGHLTATSKDAEEIKNWQVSLQCGSNFPFIQSTKSTIGHCLAAAGSIECVASVLQLYNGYIAPSTNCEDLLPEIEQRIGADRITKILTQRNLQIVAKASFGFGDVNACLLFKKWG
ncbi:beta-ketoacyl-[acyl-carrier-protein] synthase family protein [Flavobacteriaceae bacterium F08102]|nr:beta-ketoacyl-[acyl-carrier-protein] synthase family protein [Flavobacteriaceae bacterium F08102]